MVYIYGNLRIRAICLPVYRIGSVRVIFMNKVIKERLKKEEDVIRDQYDYWLEQVEIEGKEVIQKDIDAMASGATYSLYLIYEG